MRIAAALAVTAAAGAVGSPSPGAVADRCAGALFAPRFGVAACGERLLVTRDWRAWRVVTPPRHGIGIHDVFFLDSAHGWVVTNACAGREALVYRTSDSGRTWRSTPVPPTNCAAGSRLTLFFLDSRRGWITRIFENGNNQFVARTVDGGASWSRAEEIPFIGSVVFRTSGTGWIGRADFTGPQQLAVTRDGGHTWHRRVLSPPRGWSGARLFPEVPTFFRARGVLPVDLVAAGRTAVAFYLTEDGGRTWRVGTVRAIPFGILERFSPFVHYVPTSIASPSDWWVIGGRLQRTVYVTSDAGRSWRVFHPRELPGSGFAAVTAVDALRAWIAGPTLIATEDGGRSWRTLDPR